MENAIVIHYDKAGQEHYIVNGDFRFFIVDERAPNDRVYEWLSRDRPEAISTILGSGKIGSNQDDRHAAIKARIEAALDGKPHHLTVIE